MASISKKTSEHALAVFNEQLRASEPYRAWMIANKIDPSRPIRLTDRQRADFKRYLAREGWDLGGLEIDPAANANQNEGAGKWAKDWRTYAVIGGAAAGGLGIAAAMGAGGAGAGAGAAGAGGTLASSQLAMSPLYTGPVIGAGGAAAGTAAGAGAGALSTASIARDVLRAGSVAAGEASQAAANNRSERIDAAATAEELDRRRRQLAYEQQIARALDARESGEMAFKQAMRAGYVEQPNLPSSARYQPHRSETQLAAAAASKAEAMKRLQHGDSFLPPVGDPGRFQFDPSDVSGSGLETGLGWGSAAAGIASKIPAGAWRRLIDWVR